MLIYKESTTGQVVVPDVPWSSNDKIGWWRDNQELTLYHGTHIDNLLRIVRNGLMAPSTGPTSNWVSLAFEKNTALGYASMSGGESTFRSAGSKARHTPMNERVCLIYRFPTKYILDNMDPKLGGNMDVNKKRLTNEEEYVRWNRSDQEYYMLSEIRLPKVVDTKYLIGYTQKR